MYIGVRSCRFEHYFDHPYLEKPVSDAFVYEIPRYAGRNADLIFSHSNNLNDRVDNTNIHSIIDNIYIDVYWLRSGSLNNLDTEKNAFVSTK